MSRALALIAIVMLGACSGSFGERVHESFHQTIDAGTAPLVRVDNVAGTVRIDGRPKSVVDVVATKYGHDAQELRDVTIDVRRKGGEVSVLSSYAGGMHGGGVRYRIAVPSDASVSIVNVAGSVEIVGVRGNVDVRTQAGEITASAGRVSGNRSIDLRATTGAVALSIAPQSSARVEAYSAVGEFTSDVSGVSQRREQLVGAAASGAIGSGSARIRLTTTTGAITLREITEAP